ncbi:MAG TPA: hypothetical protein VLA14_17645 [Polyangia bacterium]|nr:hypothetical protein [Polyangia bacterium]
MREARSKHVQVVARRKKRLALARLAFALGGATFALAGGACGKLKPAEGADASTTSDASTGRTIVTISGTAAPLPLNALVVPPISPADFSMLEVAIVDPQAVLADPAAAPLGSMTLDTTTTNCDATLGCAWSLPGVDITDQKLGLVGTLADLRTGAAREWVKTGTGLGSAADVQAVIAAPAPITDRRAFIVSLKLEALLGAFVGKALGQTFNPGDLETRGFLIGYVVGKPSEGTFPPPIAGATVSATGAFDVIYPNADFSATGTATSTSGVFLMVPKMAASVVATWTVNPPATETRTWNQYLAGANPGNAFIIILAANE